MSILIKGMEMPTSCRECPLERKILERYVCAISGKARNWELETRLSDCPLIPIPPHGRLIDADKLIKGIAMDRRGWFDNADSYIAEHILFDAPTIIEAEPPKEEAECSK